MLLRVGARHTAAAAAAGFLLAATPAPALQALLLAGALGLAAYWPLNFSVLALLLGGSAGCLYGGVVCWERGGGRRCRAGLRSALRSHRACAV